ncbi:MAG TPA: hypothetical protein VK084_08030 [Chitinophagaceae bacterium]|nr:hypothetical protein [Chitinophagaceae bacterium]
MIYNFTFFTKKKTFYSFLLTTLVIIRLTVREKHPNFYQDPGVPSFPWDGNGDTLNPELFSDTFNIENFLTI